MTAKDFHAACSKNAVYKDTCVVKYKNTLYFPDHIIIRFNNLGKHENIGVVQTVLSRKEVEIPIRLLEFYTPNPNDAK